MKRVLHLDDDSHHHELILTQLSLISDDIDLSLAATVSEAFTALESGNFFCLLLDAQNSDIDSKELIGRLIDSGYSLPVILFCEKLEGDDCQQNGSWEDQVVLRIGYGRFELLAKCISQLDAEYTRNQGKRRDIEDIFPGGSRQLVDAGNKLTKREREILEHIAEGKANKEIAADLFISERTVVNHVYNMFTKLGIHSRAEAVRLAIALKLIER